MADTKRLRREWRQRNRDAGRCPCGNKRFEGRSRCRRCLLWEAASDRKRKAAKKVS